MVSKPPKFHYKALPSRGYMIIIAKFQLTSKKYPTFGHQNPHPETDSIHYIISKVGKRKIGGGDTSAFKQTIPILDCAL